MLNALLDLDRQLFRFINTDCTNAFFDWIMPLMRNPKFWIPLYIFIIGFCIWKYLKQGAILILMLCLAVGFADFTSASLVKKQVQRLRPCRDPVTTATVISRVPCGTGYSFPSTHATDHFAIAIFLSCLFYRRWKWVAPALVVWAATVCFAQIYVGVHFPLDITCGAIYGSLVGWLFAVGFKKWQPGFRA
ncbi:phosphatase PAP2 family protein [Mucilaginibacter pallidiroseus]|uniref:Phosphatase PAP2 family protein n=1 Tax=Mucilaginibacter pallidiroseus TaxID=2599295 RepID=A0A563UDU8_9SPHI|nr:phosphatase PAP2 family protein [Mucilaginibacter pallidiroseus]TWR29469.1 phosphatase PAP2 family protein [Mucilaginibacter pallidiroseus]